MSTSKQFKELFNPWIVEQLSEVTNSKVEVQGEEFKITNYKMSAGEKSNECICTPEYHIVDIKMVFENLYTKFMLSVNNLEYEESASGVIQNNITKEEIERCIYMQSTYNFDEKDIILTYIMYISIKHSVPFPMLYDYISNYK